MPTARLTTKKVLQLSVTVIRGDSFEGFTLLLLDANGNVLPDLLNLGITAEIRSSASILITSFNSLLELDPLTLLPTGVIRFWLTSAQTALFTQTDDSLDQSFDCSTLYSEEEDDTPSYRCDIKIDQEVTIANLVAMNAGVFTVDADHGLAPTDTITFRDSSVGAINGIRYTGLLALTYTPPFRFTVPELSALSAIPASFNATAAASTDRLTNLSQAIVDGAIMVLSGTIPTPLVAGFQYRTRDSTGTTWRLAQVLNGPAVNILANSVAPHITCQPLSTLTGTVKRLRRDTIASVGLTALNNAP